MKSTAVKVVVALVIVAAALLIIKSRKLPSTPAPVETPSVPAAAPAVSTPVARSADPKAVEELEEKLAAERRARQHAESEAAELRREVAPLRTNVVISLGTVRDMGRRAGAMLPNMDELNSLSRRDPASLSAGEKRRLLDLQRDHAQLLGELPEITHFQDNPEDYGQFFRSMLEQAAGLNEEQAASVQDYMRQRATLMNQQGLNAGRQPSDTEQAESWEKKRDGFNEETADGLKALLPPDAASKAGVGPGLLEFLEMDFDKLAANPAGTIAP